MSFWAKLKQGLQTVGLLAPSLPIPDKAKRIIKETVEAEQAVEDVVREIKKPTKPAA